MARELHDHWFREAKREGYRSRAAYKLIDIDDRRRLLAPGMRVLDCGAAPGSWLQVAAERVGRRGRVVGVDLQRIARGLGDVVTTIEGDLRAMSAEELRRPIGGALYDVVLSDMAPSTSGDHVVDHHGSIRLCEAVLDRCPDVLVPGGALVMKAFEGEAYPDLLERTRGAFERVKGYKPAASRSSSTEMYVVATGHRPSAPSPRAEGTAPGPPPPPAGW